MLNFTPDSWSITGHYLALMPFISQISLYLEAIPNMPIPDESKQRYTAELKALRAYYTQILYLYYGPVPIRNDPNEINNPDAPPKPRPSKEEIINQIVSDFTDAAPALPDWFTGPDYGRFSKAACYNSLMKLCMQEKRWSDAITLGKSIQGLGYSLIDNYEDNFSIKSKGGNSEIILPVVCSPTSGDSYGNKWLAHVLPVDYYDSTGVPLTAWNGYRMPWKIYDKFDQRDKRLKILLQKYPTGRNGDGSLTYRDARAGGDKGAVPVKYGPDPSRANSENSGVDYVVFRYADVLLLLAEALNEQDGPVDEAYNLINQVRTRAGLPAYTAGTLNKDEFRSKLQDERLFELWGENVRRDDLIRWNLYIKRAKDDGSPFADDNKILYPLPRNVVIQSNGIIEQNPGYK